MDRQFRGWRKRIIANYMPSQRCILEGETPFVSNEFTLKNARVIDIILKEINY